MLQYLLNATAIWLLSLLMYDLLLRRESFHSYNRFYLVFTLLLGALFPLIQADNYTAIYNEAGTIQAVVSVKQNIVTAAAEKSTATDLQGWLWIIYLSGATLSCILLMTECVKLLLLYRKGKKYADRIFTIVETGKAHTPFSIVNLLFVCSREQYSAEEWQIITIHEGRHSILYHFADLLLMQFARIVFWFHPLVYVYNKRLLMVHEYQADKVQEEKAETYGYFLVEQALLGTAPAISHSFNRSPIKNRIVMLTRNSSRAARIKTLVFIPVMLTCIICFAQNGLLHKRERKGDIVTFGGNKFELSKARPGDTMYMEDPMTKEMQMKVTRIEQYPVKMNGAEIYNMEDVSTKPEPIIKERTLREYLRNQLEKQLSQLPDGKYSLFISYIITSAAGDIVYYSFDGIQMRGKSYTETPPDIPQELAKKINAKTERILDNLKVSPAKYRGKNVACLTNSGEVFNCGTSIEVKDDKVSWLDHY